MNCPILIILCWCGKLNSDGQILVETQGGTHTRACVAGMLPLPCPSTSFVWKEEILLGAQAACTPDATSSNGQSFTELLPISSLGTLQHLRFDDKGGRGYFHLTNEETGAQRGYKTCFCWHRYRWTARRTPGGRAWTLADTRGAWIRGLPSLNQAGAVASAKWFCHSHSAALYQVLMGTHHIILQQTEASNSQKYFLQFSQSIYM